MILGERGSRVRVDGQVVGQLPLVAPLPVPAGEHKLSVEGGGGTQEANIRVRTGRLLDVRFDRESGAALVSEPPVAIVLFSQRGVSDAAKSALEQTAAQALEEERLLRFDHKAALSENPKAAACIGETPCQLEFATQLEIPYVVALNVEKPSETGAWQLSGRILDTAVGDVAAQSEKQCENCTDAQAGARLSQLLRVLVVKGLSRPRGRLAVRTDPAGATVEFNGRKLGETPLDRAVFAGSAEIVLRRQGFAEERQRVTVEDGRTAKVELALTKEAPVQAPLVVTPEVPAEPVKKYERAPRSRARLAVGGVLLGAGLIVGGFGVGALSLNGQCIDSKMAPAQRCERLYDTTSLGTTLTVIGAALAIGGAVVIAIPGQRHKVERAASTTSKKGTSAYASFDHREPSAHGGGG